MKYLIVSRGLPGSGKSTFFRSAQLQPFVISPDELRMMYGSLALGIDGRLSINQKNDDRVWRDLYNIIEQRMSSGELIVVDATHTRQSYFTDYAKLAQKYRYKCLAVDFSDVPLELILERNADREDYRRVEESVVMRMHQQLQTSHIPKTFTTLSPSNLLDYINQTPQDVGHYRKVHFIGDIQGCYDPLAEYFAQNPYTTTDLYIFTGDLLDRGKQNGQVMNYILTEFLHRDNVIFVEGNHERHIWHYLTKQTIGSREFTGRTLQQLVDHKVDHQAMRRLMLKMRDFAYITHHGTTVFVSHGGISSIPENLAFVSSRSFIHGTGSYEEVGVSDDNFLNSTNSRTYLVHGHRNVQNYPIKYNDRVFNLEGKVEFGGELRIVQLESDVFQTIEISNKQSAIKLHPMNASRIHQLRQNKYIRELTLPDNLSSFSFKPEVFYKQIWDEQTVTARGLFVNNLSSGIVIRSYDKFFNINERSDTSIDALQKSLVYPVKVYQKENGYLGLLGYDEVSGQLIFASKSTTQSQFAKWFEELFVLKFGQHLPAIKNFLEENNVCLTFEVILPELDPHIVEYQDSEIVLLDIIERQFTFVCFDDDKRANFAKKFGMKTKKLAQQLDNFHQLQELIKQSEEYGYTIDNQKVEGFVLVDGRGFTFKHKVDWYIFWKAVRNWLTATITSGTIGDIKTSLYPELASLIKQHIASQNIQSIDLFQLRSQIEDNNVIQLLSTSNSRPISGETESY